MTRVDTAYPVLKSRRARVVAAALAALFADMQPDVQARYDDGARRLVSQRWDEDLAALMASLNMDTAAEVAARVASGLGVEFNPAIMANWFDANAKIAAEGINQRTADDIAAVAESKVPDPVAHIFGELLTTRAQAAAGQQVTVASNFAARDVADHAGDAVKMWRVNSKNPRSAHAALNGQSVPTRSQFSNGMDWPGDPAGGATNNAYCRCSLTIVR